VNLNGLSYCIFQQVTFFTPRGISMASPSLLALLLVALSTVAAVAMSNLIIYSADVLLPQYAARFDNYAFATGIPLAVAPLLIAPLAYAVFRLTELKAMLERNIRTDALTGLLNRRGFFEHAQRILEHGDEWSHAATIMMIDVDRFKDINDTFGHAAGDDVLRRIARGIGEAIGSDSPHNVAARIGGDEFAVVLVGLDPSAAAAAAERICRTVRYPGNDGNKAMPAPSVSVGVAMRLNREPLDVVMKAADGAAYHAKRSGRDRWEISATDTASAAAQEINSARASNASGAGSRAPQAVPAAA
jgi:diguanylate cyclase (GGDEF)-like protein